MALTTTSYAILGLLDLRDYSAYELAQQASRSLAYAWPISETQLYAEPKRLAREGLITISTAPSGPRRSRQVYAITAAGREELRHWLDTPPEAPRVQIEAMLRCLFATAGTRESLLASLRRTADDVRASYDAGRALTEAMIASEGEPFPERLHVNVLWMRLVRDLDLTIARWAEQAEQDVSSWSDVTVGRDREASLAALRDIPRPLSEA